MTNVRVYGKAIKRHKTYDHRKLRKFKEIPEMFEIDGKVLSRPPKSQIKTVVLQICKKSAINYFIEKPLLLSIAEVIILKRKIY